LLKPSAISSTWMEMVGGYMARGKETLPDEGDPKIG